MFQHNKKHYCTSSSCITHHFGNSSIIKTASSIKLFFNISLHKGNSVPASLADPSAEYWWKFAVRPHHVLHGNVLHPLDPCWKISICTWEKNIVLMNAIFLPNRRNSHNFEELWFIILRWVSGHIMVRTKASLLCAVNARQSHFITTVQFLG